MLVMLTSASAPSQKHSAHSNQDHCPGIRRTRTVVQTNRTIPHELFLQPSDDEVWVPCLVSAADVELWRKTFEELPSVHIVGSAFDGSYYEVAMIRSFLQYMIDRDFSIRLPSELDEPHDVSLPTKREIAVHGIHNAPAKARKEYIRKAIDATLVANHGRGLDRYYQDYAKPDILAAICWGFLTRDILQVNSKVRRRFFQHCIFITLHSVQDLADAAELDFMERTEEEWRQLFGDLCFERAMRPVDDPDAEMKLLSLVAAVFESALENPSQPTAVFDMSLSAQGNIEKLSTLFDCGFQPDAVPFGSLKEGETKDCLLRCDLFQDNNEVDAAGIKEQIRYCVPVGFADMEFLPVHLVHTLPYGTINFIRAERARTYHETRIPQVSENDMLIFLCSCALLPTVDAQIRNWAASSDGSAFYDQSLRRFHGKEIMHLTTLRVLATYSFEKLLPPRPNETIEPIHGCFLTDFCSHLKGKALSNRRALLGHMACSLRRVAQERRLPGVGRFLARIEPERPHRLDGFSDKYWDHKLNWELDHETAWMKALA